MNTAWICYLRRNVGLFKETVSGYICKITTAKRGQGQKVTKEMKQLVAKVEMKVGMILIMRIENWIGIRR